MRGYFGIGIENVKTESNVGGLWRTAHSFGAAFIFTIGKRYKRQVTDTNSAWKHVPLFEYFDFNDFKKNLPRDCILVGVEIDEGAIAINHFIHQDRAVYLLGAEDNGLTKNSKTQCHQLIQLPGCYSLNVATAGSIVMYDRIMKNGYGKERK